jgi:hypothetical protein
MFIEVGRGSEGSVALEDEAPEHCGVSSAERDENR